MKIYLECIAIDDNWRCSDHEFKVYRAQRFVCNTLLKKTLGNIELNFLGPLPSQKEVILYLDMFTAKVLSVLSL